MFLHKFTIGEKDNNFVLLSFVIALKNLQNECDSWYQSSRRLNSVDFQKIYLLLDACSKSNL